MISSKNGIDTLEVEVLNISPHGIWLYVKGKEYFLSYQDDPWFKESKVTDIYEVELLHDTHLRWPQLDIDLEIESLDNPGKYPLKYK